METAGHKQSGKKAKSDAAAPKPAERKPREPIDPKEREKFPDVVGEAYKRIEQLALSTTHLSRVILNLNTDLWRAVRRLEGPKNAGDESGSEEEPSGWVAYTSPDGRTYYHNNTTNETKWDRPTGVPIHNDVQPKVVWYEYKSPDGRIYYFNQLTGQTTYNKPADYTPPTTAAPAKPPQPPAPTPAAPAPAPATDKKPEPKKESTEKKPQESIHAIAKRRLKEQEVGHKGGPEVPDEAPADADAWFSAEPGPPIAKKEEKKPVAPVEDKKPAEDKKPVEDKKPEEKPAEKKPEEKPASSPTVPSSSPKAEKPKESAHAIAKRRLKAQEIGHKGGPEEPDEAPADAEAWFS